MSPYLIPPPTYPNPIWFPFMEGVPRVCVTTSNHDAHCILPPPQHLSCPNQSMKPVSHKIPQIPLRWSPRRASLAAAIAPRSNSGRPPCSAYADVSAANSPAVCAAAERRAVGAMYSRDRLLRAGVLAAARVASAVRKASRETAV